MRANRSKTGKRRSQHKLSSTRPATCACGALRVSHRACSQCGKYNGMIVIDVVERAKREARRQKRREKDLRAAGQLSESKEAKKDKEETVAKK